MSDRGYGKGDRKYEDRSQRQREDKPQAQQGRQEYRDRDGKRDHSSSFDSQRGYKGQQQRPGLPPHGGVRTQAGSQAASRQGSGPPKGPTVGGLGRGPGALSGSSLVSNLLQEAKKRQQEEQRRTTAPSSPEALRPASATASPATGPHGAAAAGEGKKRRHSPIPFPSPKRQAGAAGGSSSRRPSSPGPPATWQDRLAQEQAEFAQRQQQDSPLDDQQQQQRRKAAPPRTPSDSDPESGEEPRAGGGRWGQQEDDGDAAAAAGGAAGVRSRWADLGGDGSEQGAGGRGELEEGEMAGVDPASVAEELAEEEDLNRREAAELERAGGQSESGVGSDGEGSRGDPVPGEQAFLKSMLEECRSVLEYEKLNAISEGTYGVVFRARDKASGRVLALKRIKLEAFRYGFPQTSIREINILLSLHHRNIVNVLEVVVGASSSSKPQQVFMVMEFVDHDVKELLTWMREKGHAFSQAQVKCLLRQLLEGLAYLHEHWVLHRDLKTANLLYSNNGLLKICDFGMARQFGDPLRTYTSLVVTLYYRAIEKLLGQRRYSTALDMWSAGCIMAELLSPTNQVLFKPDKMPSSGTGELAVTLHIFDVLGTPLEEGDPTHPRYWKGYRDLPGMKALRLKPSPGKLRQKFPSVNLTTGDGLSEVGFDLLQRLLAYDPANRLSAKAALEHPWFRESPLPTQPELMPHFPSAAAGETQRQ